MILSDMHNLEQVNLNYRLYTKSYNHVWVDRIQIAMNQFCTYPCSSEIVSHHYM